MRSSDNRDSLSPTWSRAGVWGRLHQKILELPAGQDLVDLSRPGLRRSRRKPLLLQTVFLN